MTLSIYDQSNTLLASSTQTEGQFCSGFANCQQYAFHTFTFASPASLPGSGATYSAVLSSDTTPEQNTAYFVKTGGVTSFTLDTGVVPTAPDLTVTKDAATGTFNVGQTGAVYDIRVDNLGSAASTGTVTVSDTLDGNLSYVSAAGTGWSCGAASQVVLAHQRRLLPQAAQRQQLR